MTTVCPSSRKRAYDASASSIGRSASSSLTRRMRNVWNGAYHSRSQCVCGTIATVIGWLLNGLRVGSVARYPAVTDPGLGLNQARARRVVTELLAQLRDVHPQIVALGPVPRAPHLVQQVLLRQELPGIAHQLLEQHQLRAGKVHRLARPSQPPTGEL